MSSLPAFYQKYTFGLVAARNISVLLVVWGSALSRYRGRVGMWICFLKESMIMFKTWQLPICIFKTICLTVRTSTLKVCATHKLPVFQSLFESSSYMLLPHSCSDLQSIRWSRCAGDWLKSAVQLISHLPGEHAAGTHLVKVRRLKLPCSGA